MTLKEAKETLEVAKGEVQWNYPLDYDVALDMAIASLEAWKNLRDEIEGTIDDLHTFGDMEHRTNGLKYTLRIIEARLQEIEKGAAE